MPSPNPEEPAGLSGRELAVLLGVVLLVFLFARGPVWQHPFEADASILWSYAPIPLLVAVALGRRRRLALKRWLVGTVELTAAKFITTAVILVALWSFHPRVPTRPPVVRAGQPTSAAPRAASPPAPTPLMPQHLGRVTGTVRRGEVPVAGALVWLSSGAEGLVFSPPPAPAELTNHGQGFGPSPATAQTGQHLRLRSADGKLHSFHAAAGARGVLNVAVPASASGTDHVLTNARGLLSTRCTVHASGERSGWLLVLPHPFSTRSDAAGRFMLDGVPAGSLEVSVVDAAGATGRTRVELEAGATANADLHLGPGPR